MAGADGIELVSRERDPIERARLAGEWIAIYRRRSAELAQLRKDAINEAAAAGMTFAGIADELGLTRGRISQIRRSTPTADVPPPDPMTS